MGGAAPINSRVLQSQADSAEARLRPDSGSDARDSTGSSDESTEIRERARAAAQQLELDQDVSGPRSIIARPVESTELPTDARERQVHTQFREQLTRAREIYRENPEEAWRIISEILPPLVPEINQTLRSTYRGAFEDLALLREYFHFALQFTYAPWSNEDPDPRSGVEGRFLSYLEVGFSGNEIQLQMLRNHLLRTLELGEGQAVTAQQLANARMVADISFLLCDYLTAYEQRSQGLGEWASPYSQGGLAEVERWGQLVEAAPDDLLSPEQRDRQYREILHRLVTADRRWQAHRRDREEAGYDVEAGESPFLAQRNWIGERLLEIRPLLQSAGPEAVEPLPVSADEATAGEETTPLSIETLAALAPEFTRSDFWSTGTPDAPALFSQDPVERPEPIRQLIEARDQEKRPREEIQRRCFELFADIRSQMQSDQYTRRISQCLRRRQAALLDNIEGQIRNDLYWTPDWERLERHYQIFQAEMNLARAEDIEIAADRLGTLWGAYREFGAVGDEDGQSRALHLIHQYVSEHSEAGGQLSETDRLAIRLRVTDAQIETRDPGDLVDSMGYLREEIEELWNQGTAESRFEAHRLMMEYRNLYQRISRRFSPTHPDIVARIYPAGIGMNGDQRVSLGGVTAMLEDLALATTDPNLRTYRLSQLAQAYVLSGHLERAHQVLDAMEMDLGQSEQGAQIVREVVVRACAGSHSPQLLRSRVEAWLRQDQVSLRSVGATPEQTSEMLADWASLAGGLQEVGAGELAEEIIQRIHTKIDQMPAVHRPRIYIEIFEDVDPALAGRFVASLRETLRCEDLHPSDRMELQQILAMHSDNYEEMESIAEEFSRLLDTSEVTSEEERLQLSLMRVQIARRMQELNQEQGRNQDIQFRYQYYNAQYRLTLLASEAPIELINQHYLIANELDIFGDIPSDAEVEVAMQRFRERGHQDFSRAWAYIQARHAQARTPWDEYHDFLASLSVEQRGSCLRDALLLHQDRPERFAQMLQLVDRTITAMPEGQPRRQLILQIAPVLSGTHGRLEAQIREAEGRLAEIRTAEEPVRERFSEYRSSDRGPLEQELARLRQRLTNIQNHQVTLWREFAEGSESRTVQLFSEAMVESAQGHRTEAQRLLQAMLSDPGVLSDMSEEGQTIRAIAESVVGLITQSRADRITRVLRALAESRRSTQDYYFNPNDLRAIEMMGQELHQFLSTLSLDQIPRTFEEQLELFRQQGPDREYRLSPATRGDRNFLVSYFVGAVSRLTERDAVDGQREGSVWRLIRSLNRLDTPEDAEAALRALQAVLDDDAGWYFGANAQGRGELGPALQDACDLILEEVPQMSGNLRGRIESFRQDIPNEQEWGAWYRDIFSLETAIEIGFEVVLFFATGGVGNIASFALRRAMIAVAVRVGGRALLRRTAVRLAIGGLRIGRYMRIPGSQQIARIGIRSYLFNYIYNAGDRNVDSSRASWNMTLNTLGSEAMTHALSALPFPSRMLGRMMQRMTRVSARLTRSASRRAHILMRAGSRRLPGTVRTSRWIGQTGRMLRAGARRTAGATTRASGRVATTGREIAREVVIGSITYRISDNIRYPVEQAIRQAVDAGYVQQAALEQRSLRLFAETGDPEHQRRATAARAEMERILGPAPDNSTRMVLDDMARELGESLLEHMMFGRAHHGTDARGRRRRERQERIAAAAERIEHNAQEHRRHQSPRSHALRGNAAPDAPRLRDAERPDRRSHGDRGNERIRRRTPPASRALQRPRFRSQRGSRRELDFDPSLMVFTRTQGEPVAMETGLAVASTAGLPGMAMIPPDSLNFSSDSENSDNQPSRVPPPSASDTSPTTSSTARNRELDTLRALMQSPEFAVEMAAWLDGAYYRGTGQAVPPFNADPVTREIHENVAMNLAGFYAVECGMGVIAEWTEESPLEILQRIMTWNIPTGDMLLLARFANATWKAGQPFRGLARISRPNFIPAAQLSHAELRKDFDQIGAAAALMHREVSSRVEDPSDVEAQRDALQQLLQSQDFAVEMAAWMDGAYYRGQGQTPPAFNSASISREVHENIAMNLAGFYAVESGVGHLSERDGRLPSEILQQIVDGSLHEADMLLLARFANATWKAGQPFRSLGRIARPNFIPAVRLSEAELRKDFDQIRAAAQRIIEALRAPSSGGEEGGDPGTDGENQGNPGQYPQGDQGESSGFMKQEETAEAAEASDTPSSSPLLNRAIKIATWAHRGQADKGGHPYIGHPLRVMERLSSESLEVQMAAVLHDVLEDTRWQRTELRRAGIPEEVIDAVEALSKREDEHGDDGYMRFIQRAATNPIAARVKLADLLDNMDISRIPEAERSEKVFARWRKYRGALDLLLQLRPEIQHLVPQTLPGEILVQDPHAQAAQHLGKRYFNRRGIDSYNSFMRESPLGDLAENIQRRVSASSRPIRILDAGAGRGNAAKELRQRFGEHIVVETNDLQPLESGHSDRHHQGDFLSADLAGNYDLILSIFGPHSYSNGRLLEMLQRSAELLAPDGECFAQISLDGFRNGPWHQALNLFYASSPAVEMTLADGLILRVDFPGRGARIYMKRIGDAPVPQLRTVLERALRKQSSAPMSSWETVTHLDLEERFRESVYRNRAANERTYVVVMRVPHEDALPKGLPHLPILAIVDPTVEAPTVDALLGRVDDRPDVGWVAIHHDSSPEDYRLGVMQVGEMQFGLRQNELSSSEPRQVRVILPEAKGEASDVLQNSSDHSGSEPGMGGATSLAVGLATALTLTAGDALAQDYGFLTDEPPKWFMAFSIFVVGMTTPRFFRNMIFIFRHLRQLQVERRWLQQQRQAARRWHQRQAERPLTTNIFGATYPVNVKVRSGKTVTRESYELVRGEYFDSTRRRFRHLRVSRVLSSGGRVIWEMTPIAGRGPTLIVMTPEAGAPELTIGETVTLIPTKGGNNGGPFPRGNSTVPVLLATTAGAATLLDASDVFASVGQVGEAAAHSGMTGLTVALGAVAVGGIFSWLKGRIFGDPAPVEEPPAPVETIVPEVEGRAGPYREAGTIPQRRTFANQYGNEYEIIPIFADPDSFDLERGNYFEFLVTEIPTDYTQPGHVNIFLNPPLGRRENYSLLFIHLTMEPEQALQMGIAIQNHHGALQNNPRVRGLLALRVDGQDASSTQALGSRKRVPYRSPRLVSASGEEHSLNFEYIKKRRIGKNPDADLVLSSPHVSQYHAQIIETEPGIHFIRDLKSTNGIYLNGNHLDPDILALLNDGDEIQLGTERLIWRSPAADPTKEGGSNEGGGFGGTTALGTGLATALTLTAGDALAQDYGPYTGETSNWGPVCALSFLAMFAGFSYGMRWAFRRWRQWRAERRLAASTETEPPPPTTKSSEKESEQGGNSHDGTGGAIAALLAAGATTLLGATEAQAQEGVTQVVQAGMDFFDLALWGGGFAAGAYLLIRGFSWLRQRFRQTNQAASNDLAKLKENSHLNNGPYRSTEGPLNIPNFSDPYERLKFARELILSSNFYQFDPDMAVYMLNAYGECADEIGFGPQLIREARILYSYMQDTSVPPLTVYWAIHLFGKLLLRFPSHHDFVRAGCTHLLHIRDRIANVNSELADHIEKSLELLSKKGNWEVPPRSVQPSVQARVEILSEPDPVELEEVELESDRKENKGGSGPGGAIAALLAAGSGMTAFFSDALGDNVAHALSATAHAAGSGNLLPTLLTMGTVLAAGVVLAKNSSPSEESSSPRSSIYDAASDELHAVESALVDEDIVDLEYTEDPEAPGERWIMEFGPQAADICRILARGDLSLPPQISRIRIRLSSWRSEEAQHLFRLAAAQHVPVEVHEGRSSSYLLRWEGETVVVEDQRSLAAGVMINLAEQAIAADQRLRIVLRNGREALSYSRGVLKAMSHLLSSHEQIQLARAALRSWRSLRVLRGDRSESEILRVGANSQGRRSLRIFDQERLLIDPSPEGRNFELNLHGLENGEATGLLYLLTGLAGELQGARITTRNIPANLSRPMRSAMGTISRRGMQAGAREINWGNWGVFTQAASDRPAYQFQSGRPAGEIAELLASHLAFETLQALDPEATSFGLMTPLEMIQLLYDQAFCHVEAFASNSRTPERQREYLEFLQGGESRRLWLRGLQGMVDFANASEVNATLLRDILQRIVHFPQPTGDSLLGVQSFDVRALGDNVFELLRIFQEGEGKEIPQALEEIQDYLGTQGQVTFYGAIVGTIYRARIINDRSAAQELRTLSEQRLEAIARSEENGTSYRFTIIPEDRQCGNGDESYLTTPEWVVEALAPGGTRRSLESVEVKMHDARHFLNSDQEGPRTVGKAIHQLAYSPFVDGEANPRSLFVLRLYQSQGENRASILRRVQDSLARELKTIQNRVRAPQAEPEFRRRQQEALRRMQQLTVQVVFEDGEENILESVSLRPAGGKWSVARGERPTSPGGVAENFK